MLRFSGKVIPKTAKDPFVSVWSRYGRAFFVLGMGRMPFAEGGSALVMLKIKEEMGPKPLFFISKFQNRLYIMQKDC